MKKCYFSLFLCVFLCFFAVFEHSACTKDVFFHIILLFHLFVMINEHLPLKMPHVEVKSFEIATCAINHPSSNFSSHLPSHLFSHLISCLISHLISDIISHLSTHLSSHLLSHLISFLISHFISHHISSFIDTRIFCIRFYCISS